MFVGPWSEFLQYKQQRGAGIRLASLEATGPILPPPGEPLAPGSPRAVDQSALSPTFQAGISSGSSSMRRPAPPVLGSVVRARNEGAEAGAQGRGEGGGSWGLVPQGKGGEEGGARGQGRGDARASHASTQRARMEAMRALYSGTGGGLTRGEGEEELPPPSSSPGVAGGGGGGGFDTLRLQGEPGSALREAHLLSLLRDQAAAIAALTAGQARLHDAVALLLRERAQAAGSASAASPHGTPTHGSPAHRRPPPSASSVLDDLSPGPELRAALDAAVGEGEEEEDWGGMLPTGEIAYDAALPPQPVATKPAAAVGAVSEVDRLQGLFKRKPAR